MNKSKFSKPPSDKERAEKEQSFIDDADVGTDDKDKEPNNDENETKTVEHWGTTLYPEYIDKIKAIAFYDRCSQSDVIKNFLDGYGYNSEFIEKALTEHKKYLNREERRKR